MSNLDTEREHLAKAERDIVEGERRISRQMFLIERMQQQGLDMAEAERLLLTLQGTLGEWQAHRDQIPRELEQPMGFILIEGCSTGLRTTLTGE